MREFIYWGWETKLGRSPLSPPFFRLMNGHEFHDRPPVSTLMMELERRGEKKLERQRERERKRGATVDPIPSPVYTQFVSSHADTFIFLRDMLIK